MVAKVGSCTQMHKHTHANTSHMHLHTYRQAYVYTKGDTSVTDLSGEAGEANRCAGNYLDPPDLGRDMGTSCQEVEFSPSVSPAVAVPCPTIHMLSESSGAVSPGLTAAAGGGGGRVTPATSPDAEPAALPSGWPR